MQLLRSPCFREIFYCLRAFSFCVSALFSFQYEMSSELKLHLNSRIRIALFTLHKRRMRISVSLVCAYIPFGAFHSTLTGYYVFRFFAVFVRLLFVLAFTFQFIWQQWQWRWEPEVYKSWKNSDAIHGTHSIHSHEQSGKTKKRTKSTRKRASYRIAYNQNLFFSIYI